MNFERLTLENVLDSCDVDLPEGVIVDLGWQTPLRLCKTLEANGITILGTSPDDIGIPENRKRFGTLLKK